MATSSFPFSVVVVDIAAHEQREGTGTGFFLYSCAENLLTFSAWPEEPDRHPVLLFSC
jgi:hypothetical protein